MTQREKRERGGEKNNCVCSSRRRRKRTNKKALLPSTVVALSAMQGVNGSNLLFSPAGRERILILIAWLFEKLSITSLGDTFCVESKKKNPFPPSFPLSARPPVHACRIHCREVFCGGVFCRCFRRRRAASDRIGEEEGETKTEFGVRFAKIFSLNAPPPSPSKLKSNSPISYSSSGDPLLPSQRTKTGGKGEYTKTRYRRNVSLFALRSVGKEYFSESTTLANSRTNPSPSFMPN